ncbi:MAG: hypothetical protein SPG50_02050 [Muribaculaceae bacterium]|nr:hypothetical protein [Muribaculaceae bacterium]
MRILSLIGILLSCCISFSGEPKCDNAQVIKNVLIKNNVISPTDSIDNLVWAKANIESVILHKDYGPFEMGDSIFLHKQFYVISYRVVSDAKSQSLGGKQYSYHDSNTFTWLIPCKGGEVFQINIFQFGFPPSFNSSLVSSKRPEWFPALKKKLFEPKTFWKSNTFGLNYFD